MHGRHAAEAIKRKQPVSYDDVHSLVDDHSRLAFSEVLADEKGATRAGFLTRAADYFAEHGFTSIERVMTGNAWAYKHSQRLSTHSSGPPRRSSDHTAPGRTARSNDSTAPWPPSGPTGRPSPATTNAPLPLASFIEHYNTRRRYNAHGGKPPTSRLPPT